MRLHITLLFTALGLLGTLSGASLREVGGGGPSPFGGGGYDDGSSPFGDGGGSSRYDVERNEDFDIARIGSLGRSETSAKFMEIWAEFRKTHAYTDEGDIIEGSGMPDNAQTQNAFLHYVASNHPEVKLPFNERCKRCNGTGGRPAIVNDGRGGPGVNGIVRCEPCEGRGKTKGVVTYRLYNTGRLPARMDSPSEIKLKGDREGAERGDSKAQLALGDRYWDGKGVIAEPKTAILWYARSAGNGNAAAADALIRIYSGGRSNYATDPGFAAAVHTLFKAKPGVGIPWDELKHPNGKLGETECQMLLAQIRSLKASGAAPEIYLDNENVRRSFARQLDTMVAKANGGDAEAMFKLAAVRMFGLGETKKDQAAGIELAEKSAAKGNPDALYLLATCFADGTGYTRNYTAAHVLYSVSAALGPVQSPAKVQRDLLASATDFATSQKVATEIRTEAAAGKLTVERLRGLSSLPPGQEPVTYATDNDNGGGRTPQPRHSSGTRSEPGAAYGSGVVFTNQGHIFTNQHVVNGASACYVVRYENGILVQKLPARIVQVDSKTDLAIIQCSEWRPAPGSPPSPPPIAPSRACRLGDTVFVLGFPLPGTVSSNVKYTKGDISDMSGLHDDSSRIQHTAAIQPGNSGGPMCLMDGRVVGLVVSSLSEGFALRTSGSLPQGVNFSVKSDFMLTLAQLAGVQVPASEIDGPPVEHVKAYTVQIYCER